MGIFNFNKKSEKRSEDIPAENTLLRGFLFGSEMSVPVALSLPEFAACVNFICSAAASVPINLYRDVDGKVEIVKDDIRTQLLNYETRDTMDAYQMRYAWVRDYLLYGSGYIYINRKKNMPIGLYHVQNGYVNALYNNDPIFKDYDLQVNGKAYRSFDFLKILRESEDGIFGKGIVAQHDKQLGLAASLTEFEKYLVQTGGTKKGFLKSEKQLTQSAIDSLKDAWARLFSNSSENNMMVLNSGIDYQAASSTSVEMQLNEIKADISRTICAMFNLSPDVVFGKADYKTLVSAYQISVVPILKQIEAALNKDLLLESEKKEMYYEFDKTEFVKADILTRYQAYKVGIESHFLQIEDVRFAESLPPLGLENLITFGLNDAFMDTKTKEVYTINTNQTMKMFDKTQNQNGGAE